MKKLLLAVLLVILIVLFHPSLIGAVIHGPLDLDVFERDYEVVHMIPDEEEGEGDIFAVARRPETEYQFIMLHVSLENGEVLGYATFLGGKLKGYYINRQLGDYTLRKIPKNVYDNYLKYFRAIFKLKET